MTRRRRLWPCLLFWGLAACGQADAPSNIGVCWRTADGAPSRPKFEVVAKNVASLDDCAALLEAYHLQGARTSNGAFQGYFIFVDDSEVASATQADGFHYPIFQPSQRSEIDGDLRRLIKERAGQPFKPDDVAVERQ